MESKAHYALIGTLVLAFIIAALSAILWLSGSNLDQDYDEYTVTFDGPIRGVQEAAEVRFNGIQVGEVTELRLDPDDTNKVLVKISVNESTPVDTASYAQLEAQGLTGLNIIQLFSGGTGYPLLKDMPGRGPYIIEGRESQFDSLITGGGSIVDSAQQALTQLTGAMDEESIQNFKNTLANIEQITAEYSRDPLTATRIETTLAAIEQASADVSIASLSVDQTALETRVMIEEQVKPIVMRLNATITEVETTLQDTQVLLRSSLDVTGSTNALIQDLSNGGLQDLEVAAANLTELIDTLNRVALELERNPSSFIVGERKNVMELPR